MRFLVPTNWTKDLIIGIKDKTNFDEVYGRLSSDFIGGASCPHMPNFISKKQAYLHINELHKYNIQFNYFLNSACLGNKEFSISGQRKIQALIQWLKKIEVDSITVSIPYLLRMIKKQYPQFKVNVSLCAGIDSVQRAKYWEDLGADQLTLASYKLNRNFQLLKKIRKNIKSELALTLNSLCLYNCPSYQFHMGNLSAHASQSKHYLSGFMVDYYLLNCRFLMLRNPVEIIHSPWIRPEDVHYYEDIGIDKLKIIDGSALTKTILLRVKAYNDRYYDGNLMDLLDISSRNRLYMNSSPLRYFLQRFSVNSFKLMKIMKLPSDLGIYVDNRSLDGFLENFLRKNCDTDLCEDCDYCRKIADKALKIDEKLRKELENRYKESVDEFSSGRIFR